MTRLAIVMVAGLLGAASAAGRASCACDLRLDGLRDHYEPTDTITLALVNDCDQEMAVNVAVESSNGNDWSESVASISDPKHPYGKAIKLTRVGAGATVKVNYQASPKAGPIRAGMFTRFP